MDKIHTIHLIAICGTGMGSFAGMLKAAGYQVSGSDENVYPPMSDLLRGWGVPILQGFKPSNLDHNPDLVIVGNVCRRTNPECVEMEQRGMRYMSFPQALAELFLDQRKSIVISGTHGKTTTSSICGWILADGGFDPGFMIGGVMENLQTNHRLGDGPWFVIEGDEYDTAYFDKRPKFLHYRPHLAVVTSIEFDHADIYRDLQHIVDEFTAFCELIPEQGRLIYWADCETIPRILPACKAPMISYGLGENAAWQAVEVEVSPTVTRFAVRDNVDGSIWGRFESPLWGEHNLLNVLAALAVAREAGSSPEAAARSLRLFKGAKRRQTVIYQQGDRTVVDDYAHHPTAVRETIRAVRTRFPEHRLWALFEAESNTSRRRVFQETYATVFDQADLVVFAKPLKKNDKLTPDQQIDVSRIVEELNGRGIEAYHVPEADQIVDFVVPRFREGDVILMMSGRDFQGLESKLLAALNDD